MVDFDKMKEAMGDLDEDVLNGMLEEVMADGGKDVDQALAACQEGMNLVGDRFEKGEYFVGDLIFAGEMLTGGMEIIKPALADGGDAKSGKLILCTVKDDLHDIGKNIVRSLLEAAGFEVIDLGIDTPADKIVSTAEEQGVHIVALSGVLTLALDSMKATVKAFEDAGIRDDVKIIIGGNPVSAEACTAMGADEWAHSPQKTVDVCKKWSAAA